MSLFQLTYISTLSAPDGLDIANIIKCAESNNVSMHITGMLLCLDGSVMQTLEGRRSDVEALYDRILQDKRHFGVVEMIREEISLRGFSDWSVGYRGFAIQVVATLPKSNSYFKHSQHEVNARVRGGKARLLLTNFGVPK